MKRVSVVALVVLVVLAAAAWLWRSHAKPDKTVDASPRDSLVFPSDVPEQLRNWILESLWRSGAKEWQDSLLAADPKQRTRLRKEGDTWVVDFRGLPISILGTDQEDELSEDTVRILVAGTNLCDRDMGLRVGKSILDRVVGLDSARCTEADQVGLAERWFKGVFGRAPAPGEIVHGGKRIAAIRVKCGKNDSLDRLGLLWLGQPETLEIDGCNVPEFEQNLIPSLNNRSLALRNLKGESVLLSGMGNLEPHALLISGGNVKYLELPDRCDRPGVECGENPHRLPTGASVVLSRLSVCSERARSELRSKGYEVEDPACGAFPRRLDSLHVAWSKEWDSISLQDQPDFDTTNLIVQPQLQAVGDEVYKEPVSVEQGVCGEYAAPYEQFSVGYLSYGKDWVGDDFRTGDAVRLKAANGKEIRSGMTRDELVAILGKPTMRTGSFVAWGARDECGDPSNFVYRAHFDADGKLDGWFDGDLACEGGC